MYKMSTINILNYDCLIHIFKFCGPKDWLVFSKVCERWNDVTEFVWGDEFGSYFLLIYSNPLILSIENTISFSEVTEIVNLISPRLKNVSLYVHDKETTNEENLTEEYLCSFGKYYYKVDENYHPYQLQKLLEILSSEACNIETLKISNFAADENLLWKKMIANNPKITSLKLHFSWNRLLDTDLIKDILLGVPETLQSLRLYVPKNMNFDACEQLIDKQTNLTRINVTTSHLKNKFITTLLKHADTLKKISLHSENCHFQTTSTCVNDATILSNEKLIDISKCKNLEKIHLNGNLPVNDRTITNIVQSCRNICQMKLGSFSLSQEVIDSVLLLPTMKNLALIIRDNFIQLNPPKEMEQLKVLRLDILNEQQFDFVSFAIGINKMPALSKLILLETKFEFCKKPIFTIIRKILSLGKYVKIETYLYSNRIKEIEIFVKRNEISNNLSNSKDSCFKLQVLAECFDTFAEAYRKNESLLVDCDVFIKNNEYFTE